MKKSRARRSAKFDGDCYKVAADMVLDAPHGAMKLAHGNCTGCGPIKGMVIGHAWAEVAGMVFDFSNGQATVLKKEIYYKAGKCRNVTRYTQSKTQEMLLKHKHYGPWNEHSQKIPNKRLTTPRALIK